MTMMKLSEIRVEERFRKELGDIDTLAASMAELGLLQPVLVRPDGLLVAGERRLAAAQQLGWEEIAAHTVEGFEDAAQFVKAERDENTCRKSMTYSELVAIGKRLEELAKIEAKARQGRRTDLEPKDDTSGNSAPQVRRARDDVGDALGISSRTYERARAVVDAMNDPDPQVAEVAREAVARMDATGSVQPAYKKVVAARNPVPEATTEERDAAFTALLASLRGVAKVIREDQVLRENLEEFTKVKRAVDRLSAALAKIARENYETEPAES